MSVVNIIHKATSVCERFINLSGTRRLKRSLALALALALFRASPPARLYPACLLTMHELKELVDHRLQELPVGPEEAGVLAHDVHDVGGYDGLVVLPPFLLTQPQQVLQNGTRLISYAYYYYLLLITMHTCRHVQ